MHDPMTVAFDIKYPWRDGHGTYRAPFITIWHVDPEKDGSDDSCDWFGGRKLTDSQRAVRDKIASMFAFEWHRGKPYERFGWFMPSAAVDGKWCDGEPNYTTHAIVLAMFRIAANEHFGHWSKKANNFLRHNLFDILFFAENSCDSLCTKIEQKHGLRSEDGDYKKQAKQMASIVYGWILRYDRPWYRHPRWHVWHWHIQLHPWQKFRRWLLTRCSVCGKGFKWGECPIGSWDSPPRRWFESFRGERGLRHSSCDDGSMVPANKVNGG